MTYESCVLEVEEFYVCRFDNGVYFYETTLRLLDVGSMLRKKIRLEHVTDATCHIMLSVTSLVAQFVNLAHITQQSPILHPAFHRCSQSDILQNIPL